MTNRIEEYINFSLKRLADVIGAELPSEINSDIICGRVLTQSEYVKPGEVVISAGWYEHDKIISEALSKGAIAVFCDNKVKERYPQINVIPVDNPLECVKKFERWREKVCSAKRIAITGSVGKTTTTGLINSVVASSFDTLTHHSMSNSHGAVLRNFQRLMPNHEFWVQEVGGVQPGYVESSACVLNPDVAVLTNIGESHLDKYITKENILKDKGSIEKYLKEDGTVIINNDDELLKNAKFSHNVVRISMENKNCDYFIECVKTLYDGIEFVFSCNEGRFKAKLNLYGDYNAYNGVMAIAVGKIIGVPIETSIKLIAKYNPAGMRQNFRNIGGYRMLIDCFNAEPKTVLGSAETLIKMPLEPGGRRIFVTGHIDKLGTNSKELHRKLGAELSKLNIDKIVLFGGDSDCVHEELINCGYKNSLLMESRSDLDNWLRKNINYNDVTFYKSGQFETALAKTIDNVYGTKLQNEQQSNEGYVVEKDGFKIRIRCDNIAEIEGYVGESEIVDIPKDYEGIPIVRISNRAFRRNLKITEVKIPDTVTYIGQEAFYICTNLNKVQLPRSLKYIDKNAFNYCKKLNEVKIPKGTIHIDRHGFYDCVSLKKIEIPDTVGYFGEDVFHNCPNLTIICEKNSIAAQYCRNKGIKVNYIIKAESNKTGFIGKVKLVLRRLKRNIECNRKIGI